MIDTIPNFTDGRCCVCDRINCEGDCPVSGVRTFLLVCDLCGDRTRVIPEDKYAGLFLDEWRQEHDVHHVYIDPPGKAGPPVLDPLDAPIQRCEASGKESACD
jgi:hypothetical protein